MRTTSSNNNLWHELVSNLREQRRLVHKLLKLSREQALALAHADVTRLAEITQEQASLLDELDALEHRRRECTQAIGELAGLHAARPTLTDCVHLAPAKTAQTLQHLQQTLVQDIRELQALNERNRTIVGAAAETVNTWLAVVVSAAQNQISYHPYAVVATPVSLDTEV